MRRRTLLIASAIAGVGLFMLGIAVSAQTGVPVIEPSAAMLSTAAGLSVIIAVLMNLGRGVIDPATFNRFAPITSAFIGVVLAGITVVVTATEPVTGISLLNAGLVGLFAGGYSQNINTILTRTITPTEELAEV